MKKSYLCVPAMMLSMILLIVCSCKNEQKQNDYDWSNPVSVVEAIGQEVSDNHDKWTSEDWNTASDNLETALRNLPKPMADNEVAVFNTAISRMSIYGERHKSKAERLLAVIDNYRKSGVVVSSVTVNTVAGLLQGSVIQEGGYTNIRKGPGVNYEEASKIKDGSPIYYTVYNDKWCIVYDNNGQALGYIHASKVIPASSATAQAPQKPVEGTPYDWLSARKLTDSDLEGLTREELRIMRNSIYARHGRIFQSKDLRQYFMAQSWYNGYRNEVPTNELNATEKYNIKFLEAYE